MKPEIFKLTIKTASRIIVKKKLVAFIALSLLVFQVPSYSQEEKPFKVWLSELRTEAEGRGFSKKSIDSAFSEIKEPVKRIVSSDRNQPEVVESYAGYLNRRVTAWRKINGKKMIKKHQELLQKRLLLILWIMFLHLKGTLKVDTVMVIEED